MKTICQTSMMRQHFFNQPSRVDKQLFKTNIPPRGKRPSLYFEKVAFRDGFSIVAGVDEVGRGSLAGPVVAAAVVLDPGTPIIGLKDSKQLSEADRLKVAERIYQKARSVAIASCSPLEVDQLNILWASLEAMRRAIERLETSPDYLLIDGNKSIPGIGIPYKTIISGDARSRSIAAASIVAKCHRDQLMRTLHEKHSVYGWDTNVGYGTRAHYEALDLHGPCDHHRQTFRLSTRNVVLDTSDAQIGMFED